MTAARTATDCLVKNLRELVSVNGREKHPTPCCFRLS